MHNTTVPIIDHPHPRDQFVREHVLARQPAIIRTGGFSSLGWRTDQWNDDYLCERVGPQPVSVQHRSGSHFGPTGSEGYRVVPFTEFVRTVMAAPSGNPDWYLNIQSMDRMMMAPALQLIGDFGIPPYFRDLMVRWITAWMGHTPQWGTSRLHNDYHDNLYAVASGQKHFKVCAPQFAPKLYTVGTIKTIHPNGIVEYQPGNYPGGPHFSKIPPGEIDLTQFPDAAEVQFEYAELEAGDLFYLPAGWFHEVSSKGRHISINFWADAPAPRQ